MSIARPDLRYRFSGPGPCPQPLEVGFAGEADGDDTAGMLQGDVGLQETAVEITTAITQDDIASAILIDKDQMGSNDRADYIMSVANSGGLSLAVLRDEVRGFCCLDHGHFFGKPFVSLLIVAPDARRQGLGAGLLSHCARMFPEVWTSTNQSNGAMRRLLETAGWRYCGELHGLDEGDPELFFRTA